MFEDFPSLVTMQVLPRVTDPSPAKRMIGQLLSSIRSSGRSYFFPPKYNTARKVVFPSLK